MSNSIPTNEPKVPVTRTPPGRDWWGEDGPKSGMCSNCGQTVEQVFCRNCGQRVVVEPLTLRGLLRDLPARFISFETGFVKTFVDLTLRPGVVAYDFVRGVRKQYANPLAYFFVAATVQLMSLTVLKPGMVEFLTDGLQKSWGNIPGLMEKLEKGLGENAIGILADSMVTLTRNAYSYLWIFFCILFALSFRCLPFAGKRRFNLSEILVVFSIYSIGHTVLLLGLVALVYVPLFGYGSWSIFIWPFYGIMLSRAAIQFFKGTWTAVIATLISLAVAFVGYLIVFYSVFILMIAMRIRNGG